MFRTETPTDFRRKLQFSGKKEGYVRECLRPATWFVTKYGKKQRYSQAEILDFLDYLDKRYERKDKDGNIIKGRETSTYVTKVIQFKIFLQSLPEDEATGRKQKVPFELPSFSGEFCQPSFTPQEIDSMIYTAVMDEKPEMVLRLVISTIYGCRAGELCTMSSERINLDHNNPTIDIPTEKKGRRIPQPIPKELVPLFSIPLHPVKNYQVQRELKRICRKAGVPWRKRAGIHSIRRSVISTLYGDTDLKEITIKRFLRWSMKSPGMGVLPRYVKIPYDITDLDVLQKHPYVAMWKEMIPFLPYLPQYKQMCNCIIF